MSPWQKLPPLDEPAPAYDNFGCGYRPIRLDLRRRLATGFGYVAVRRDDELIWGGEHYGWTAAKFERQAAADPDHDWRIQWYGALRGETYQRHGPNEWLLVATDEGFA